MKGWEVRKLGEVCAILGGATPSKDKPDYYTGNIPWATVRDMRADLIERTEFSITKEAVANCSTNVVPSENVVIATRVGLGKICIVKNDTAINQDLRGVIPLNPRQLDRRYLFHWFRNIAHLIVAEGTGATVQGVKLPFIKGLEIPLPPLEEQRRIVAVLDEAFAGLAVMRANAEANLANARALFDSHLNALFSQKGESWAETTIEKEADIKVGFAFKSEKYIKSGNGVRLLRGDNIIQGELRWDDCKLWPADDVAEYEDYQLSGGDIVLAMDRTWVKAGIKFAQLSAEDLPALLVQRVARLRTKDDTSQRYLFHVLGSNIFTKYVLDIQTGIGVPHISGRQIAAFKYQKPSKAKQAEIVEAIDALSLEAARLESLYRQKLAAIDELKQSLLQKAFAGELTAGAVAA